MKRSFILLFFLILFFNILFCFNIDEINSDIKKLNDYKQLLQTKEKQLNNLKLKNYSVWNFFERRNNELIIQNKNKLIKEINFLYNEINKIEDKLLNIRTEILRKNDKNLTNNNKLFDILNPIDNIKYDKLLNFAYAEYMNKSQSKEINIVNKKILNDYKNEINEFIKYLKLKLQIIKKYSLKYDDKLIAQQIETLINIYNKIIF